MSFQTILTLDDLPQNEANCATCTRQAGICPRQEKRHPNGLIKNSQTGEIGGMISYCPNYTGPYERKTKENRQ